VGQSRRLMSRLWAVPATVSMRSSNRHLPSLSAPKDTSHQKTAFRILLSAAFLVGTVPLRCRQVHRLSRCRSRSFAVPRGLLGRVRPVPQDFQPLGSTGCLRWGPRSGLGGFELFLEPCFPFASSSAIRVIAASNTTSSLPNFWSLGRTSQDIWSPQAPEITAVNCRVIGGT